MKSKHIFSFFMTLALVLGLLPWTALPALAEGTGYTVEFSRNDLEYVLPGDSSVTMSEILSALRLTGAVEAVEISDTRLFSASNETGEWIVTAHQAFSTTEWMKVTINGVVYEITVTDDVTFSGGSGTEGDPYQITTIEDMTALATLANNDSSNDRSATKGKYFKLMNDITYGTSDTFIPIGAVVDGYYKYFNGTFDGDGHTISGIKAEESDVCGLFGGIYEYGTVKNVTVDHAMISGGGGVGGIAGIVSPGYSSVPGGKIENCFVTNSTINGSYDVGAISGYKNDTFTNNYYVNCTVKVGSEDTKTSNVGCGNSGDFDGARQAYAAAQELLCQKMTDKEIYIGGTTEITPVYFDYNNGNAVSISPAVTFNGAALDASKYTVTVKDSSDQNVTGDVTAEGIYTLTVSGVNSKGYYGSASTTIAVGVGLPITAGSTKLTTGTYAVNDTLEITERIKIDGDVKLILSADKTLTASKGIDVDTGNSLTIEGEGTLIATGEKKNSGIGGSLSGSTYRAAGTITINSGTVTATGGDYAAGIGGSCSDTNSKGACHNGKVIINGGVVTANGGRRAPGIGGGAGESNNGGNGGVITINGGQVTAYAGYYEGSYTSCGMGPGGVYQSGHTEGEAAAITLGWTDSDNDFIQATSYKTASFATGKVFVLENTNTVATESNWSGQKLVPYVQPVTNIDSAVISGVDALYPYSESGISITPIVTLLENQLTAGTDYTVGYKLNGNAVDTVKDIGIYTLTVTGTGNYNGSVSTTFRVVHAKTAINYQAYESGELKNKTLAADGYTSVTNETTAMTGGWYVVQDDFTVSDRISVTGSVNLVLCDGATLTAQKGIGVTDGNSLTIYSQSGNTGGITAANSDNYYAGIGGNKDGSFNSAVKSGTITIHGGVINATGAFGSAGIGAAYEGSAGAITIYGGKVSATGGSTGIGGSGATIHLGWCRSDSDFIEAKGYEGSVTFDKVFVLDNDISITATAENSGGKKIVPTSATIHTVTFNSNGGSAVAAQNVVGGQTTPEPGKPMKQGYEFAGWYAAQDLSGDAYDFSAAVTSSFTLYAKWNAVSTISYVGTDGQTVSTSEYTPLESSYTTLPAGTFYVGANTTVSDRITVNGTVSLILGDGAKLTASKGINVPSGATLNVFCQSGGSGALTAVAEENSAGIGANYEQSTSGTVYIYGGVITATGGACAAAIGGCNGGSNGAVYIYGGTVTANGGNYAAAIGGGQLGNGGTISILGGKVTANAGTTNGTGIGADSVNSTAKSATITLGYTTTDDFILATSYCGTVTVESGKAFGAENVDSLNARDIINDLSVIGGKKLIPKIYRVQFEMNGGNSTKPADQEIHYGITGLTQIASKPAAPTRTGYTFKEWQLNDAVYDFNTVVTDNITLMATWIATATVTLTYDANGGFGAPDAQTGRSDSLTISQTVPTMYTGDSFRVTLDYNDGSGSKSIISTLHRYYYTFTEWNTARDGSGTSYQPGDAFAGYDSVTLYAQWRAGGEASAPVQLPTPKRDGYDFVGWGKNAEAETGVAGRYVPISDVTLYAVWTLRQYTLTFDTDGGTEIAPITGVAGTEIPAPADPEKFGFIFAGWDREIPTTMPNEDITVKALWKPTQFGTADFTLPAALTEIEEEAFSGAAVMAVYVPDTVETIGANAFKDCELLWKIRLPQDCEIDETAFDGCTAFLVYAPAGGTVEAFCAEQESIIFVPEVEE